MKLCDLCHTEPATDHIAAAFGSEKEIAVCEGCICAQLGINGYGDDPKLAEYKPAGHSHGIPF